MVKCNRSQRAAANRSTCRCAPSICQLSSSEWFRIFFDSVQNCVLNSPVIDYISSRFECSLNALSDESVGKF